MGRWIAGVLSLTLLAAGCGVLPGIGDGSSTVAGSGPTPTRGVVPTPVPTPRPTPVPTPTSRPTATPFPTPSPTPSVGDTYTDLLADVRDIFAAADKQAAIAELIPIPLPLTVPGDAELEQLEIRYGQWDKWKTITDAFGPVDQAADVSVEMAYSTATDIETLRSNFMQSFTDAGFTVATENSQEGQFSDVRLELNGGQFTRGLGGTGRFNILRQGDDNFVLFDVYMELESDPVPTIVEWPAIFVVPFSGGFTQFSALGVSAPDGVEVSATASWIIGLRATDIRGILETLIDAYPTDTVIVSGEINQIAPSQPAVTTFSHPTGSGGSIAAFQSADGTIIEMLIVSLAG